MLLVYRDTVVKSYFWMQDLYNLGDDSDSDEEDDEEIEVVNSVSKNTSWQPQDIEKVILKMKKISYVSL